MDNKVSIIIPVIRPIKAKRCIEAIKKNAGVSESQYEIITEIDHEKVGCPVMVKRLVEKAKHELVMFLGDDTIPQKDFLKNALAAITTFPDKVGLVGLNDNHHDGNKLATHWMASKKLLPYLDGEFFHTGYKHLRCDNELTERCIELGRYVWAKDAKIEHDNPVINGISDKDYDHIYSDENKRHDMKLFFKRKVEMGRRKIAIGLPLTDEKIYTQFFTSFVIMSKPDYTLLLPKFPGHIDAIRNNLVTQALEEDCTHLILMDTDQIYPQDCIEKLLSHDKDVIGTPVHRRWPPFDPILYRGKPGAYTHVPDKECYSGDLVKIDATGCGCLMLNTSIFFDIQMPWFQTTINEEGKTIGEDIGLCAKLRDNDIDIYVDTSIEIGHLTTYEVNRSTYELYKKLNNFQYREA